MAIRERTIEISRYTDPQVGTGSLTTSLVAIVTDARRNGMPIVGYGFSSVGRYGQGGLIRERFLPRLLKADPADLLNGDGTNLDPRRAWEVMMADEKPGGHGERCVAVGTLDMALWDAASKIADAPLHHFLAGTLGKPAPLETVAVYASGGYPFPSSDLARLAEEIRAFDAAGYPMVKIKIGSRPLDDDLRRIDIACQCLSGDHRLAVDAMSRYAAEDALTAVGALRQLPLAWLEDICDPHDFATLSSAAELCELPLAAGESLFSTQEARLLHALGGLRPERDKLLFDPVHCYGLPGYLGILDVMMDAGWPAEAFWPHGGHLFSLHTAAALGLAGAEVNPRAFAPFQGPPGNAAVDNGTVALPTVPGIGFETHGPTRRAFARLGAG